MKVDGNKMKKTSQQKEYNKQNNCNIIAYHSLQFKGTIKYVNWKYEEGKKQLETSVLWTINILKC